MANIARALKITGWLKPQEAAFLAREAAPCKKILELGSYHGRSTRIFLDNSKAHIWCVDTWRGRITRLTTATDADYNAFLKTITDARDRVTVLKMGTDQAVEVLRVDAPFDIVWIDADHTYPWVKHDIENYAPMVKEGGLLCGHDYFPKAPGLMKAVDELVGPCPKTATIWYIRRDEKWPI